MPRSGENKALIEFAECIELYAHKNRLILRLEMEDYEAALILCQEALEWCNNLEEAATNAEAVVEHRHNCENLSLLKRKIREVLQIEQKDHRHATTAF